MSQHFRGIDKQRMTTCRTLVRNSKFIQTLCQVLYLFDTSFQVIEFGIFIQTDSQSVHITTIHTSVCQVTFELHAETFSTFKPVLVTSCDESTHVHDSVFLRAHRHTVSVIEHFFHDLFNRLVLITFLTSFDEISIFRETSRVEQYTFTIFISDSTNFLDILHGNRLSSSRVIGYSYNDKRNLISVFCQYFFQFLRV